MDERARWIGWGLMPGCILTGIALVAGMPTLLHPSPGAAAFGDLQSYVVILIAFAVGAVVALAGGLVIGRKAGAKAAGLFLSGLLLPALIGAGCLVWASANARH